ncbi:MAG: hypothetical protein QM730_27070 [Anaerolineales bacterium]
MWKSRILGRKKTKIAYQEGLPEDVSLLTGEMEYEIEIEPEVPFAFSYTCVCERSGTHTFYSKRLDYAEKINAWDIVKDTVVIALPGKGPHLEGRRYYQVRPNGIELVISLENLGDKCARHLHIDNKVSTNDGMAYETKYAEEIPAKAKRPIICLVPVQDISQIILPEKTVITFWDNNQKEYVLELSDPFATLEYVFPESVDILGRNHEIDEVEKILKVVSGLAVEGQLFFVRRAILVEGMAGIGKTRFMEEIQKSGERNL